jgi:hypothetical protein
MLGTTIEEEYERRIAAINAAITACDAEEGAPLRAGASQKRPVGAVDTPLASPLPKKQSLPLQIRVMTGFLEPSLLFALNLEKKDRRYAFYVLVMLDSQKVNA